MKSRTLVPFAAVAACRAIMLDESAVAPIAANNFMATSEGSVTNQSARFWICEDVSGF